MQRLDRAEQVVAAVRMVAGARLVAHAASDEVFSLMAGFPRRQPREVHAAPPIQRLVRAVLPADRRTAPWQVDGTSGPAVARLGGPRAWLEGKLPT